MSKTTQVVRDGVRGKMSTEMWGRLVVRINGIVERIESGTLSFEKVMEQLQAVAERRVGIISGAEVEKLAVYKAELSEWAIFYKTCFGLTADFSGISIPQKPTEGYWRLLVILKGLMNNQVYDACAKHFPCWRVKGLDLNRHVPVNERDPSNGSYIIWVRDSEMIDEIHRDKTADMVRETGLKTETLLERMLHGLVHFLESGNHLDTKCFTLCSGSRTIKNLVPQVDKDNCNFGIKFTPTDDHYVSVGPREVVAIETSAEMIRREHARPEAWRL